ncbi:MAG: hypothetical protein R2932_45660 [Caldilineaceae bacterium]
MFANLQHEQLAMLTHKERLARAEQAYRYSNAYREWTPRRSSWLRGLLQQMRKRIAAQPSATVDHIGNVSRQQPA